MTRIAVVGTGYVGLTTGVSFAHLGHDVCCIDIDETKIARLREGDIPIYEPGLEDLVAVNVEAGRLSFSSSYEEGLDNVDFVFIAVGTPTSDDGHSADLRYVHAAARMIASTLTSPAIVVNKSTSPIGTGSDITRVLTETRPDLAPWRVVSNPEFLREGSAVYDCLHPARVVLGSDDHGAMEAVAALYVSLICPVIKTDLRTAEMIKYASNAFLATRISFINEVARICDLLGADVTTVSEGMGLDPRIGPAFLNAGLGYGGSCFPKDVAALAHMADCNGLHPQLLHAVMDINRDQRSEAVDRLRQHLGGLEGKTVAVWGLAFKPNTDDLREAPSLDIIQRLVDEGASVRAYDPVAAPAAAAAGVPATMCDVLYETVAGADALLLATEWPEFSEVHWAHIAGLMRGDIVFDGRNCLDPVTVTSAGLEYIGVGRPSVTAPTTLQAEVAS